MSAAAVLGRRDRALGLLGGLPIDDGRRWADAATGWQTADAAAVLLEGSETPYHWLGRPRGGSKTADIGGMALAMLLFEAPPGARLYAVAADADQGALIVDAIRGYRLRAPMLADWIKVDGRKVTMLRSGSTLEVVPADEASSWGLKPYAVFADELAVWPVRAQRLWASMVSALGKVPGARLVVLTAAGDPAHWSAKVREQALVSGRWRVSEVPGPLPWVSPEFLEEQRSLLLPSLYARLHLNVWAAGEDRLTTPEEVAACVGHSGDLEPQPGRVYVHGLDVGLKSDRTVLTVAHVERRPEPTVVVDRLFVWEGTRDRPVDLSVVEATLLEAARAYRGKLVFDPYQAAHLTQRLRRRGLNVAEFTFSSASVGRLALTLFRLLRDTRLDLPDDEPLLEELARVRLVETVPGAYRIDHSAGEHDDRVVSLALCCHELVGRLAPGAASLSSAADRALPAVNVRRTATVDRPVTARRVGRFVVPGGGYRPPEHEGHFRR